MRTAARTTATDLSERQVDKLKNSLGTLGNCSLTVAFCMDRQREEREKRRHHCVQQKGSSHIRGTTYATVAAPLLHGHSTPTHHRYTILHWRVTLHHHRRTCALGSHHQHDHGCDHTHVTTATATKHAESKDRRSIVRDKIDLLGVTRIWSGFVQDGLRHCWLPAKTTLRNKSSSALPTRTFHRISP